MVLLSGGLDSCVTAAVAARDNDLFCLHADYGQRTQSRETRAAGEVARFYGAILRNIDLSHIVVPGSSNLTDRSTPPVAGDLVRTGVPTTYVPFRNANLLAAAVSWAEVIGAGRLFIGVVEEDSSGYPDCREAFLASFQEAINTGTATEATITIVAPLLHLTKGDIIRLGVELQAPLQMTWSCYNDEELACGKCDSCLLRLRGFREVGAQDPLPYRSF